MDKKHNKSNAKTAHNSKKYKILKILSILGFSERKKMKRICNWLYKHKINIKNKQKNAKFVFF